MGLRMVPVESTFSKMRRIVRDVSGHLQKEVDLTLEGMDTEIDKRVLEGVGDPLMHLVHNALDHGIESAEERVAAGKVTRGNLTLRAYHRGENIVIECEDDGRGLDAAAIIEKAQSRGLVDARTSLTEYQAYQLLFLPGFSTRTEVTEVSGRGVGLDVVKTAVSALGGNIEIASRMGNGTTFRLVLPFTLAILDAMVVQAGESRYVVPVAHIHETLQPRPEEIVTLGQTEAIRLRGEVLPLYYFSELLGYGRGARTASEAIVLVVKSASSPAFSVVVDDILGQQQVVTKRLGDEIEGLPGLTGSAILGDGRPALVMDPVEVIEFRRGSFG
jgi:two-component system chemotaxis sensor kinase CheA